MEHCKKEIPMRAGVCVCEINSACLKGKPMGFLTLNG